MVAEHRADVLADFGALGLAAVEADRDAVTAEETREGFGVVLVPGLEQPSIELEQRHWVIGQHHAVDRLCHAIREAEAQPSPGRPLALDRAREPGRQMLRLGDRAPHLLLRVGELPLEAQLPPSVAPLLELSIA